MANLPFGLIPFNGKNDFSIWKQKLKCVLIQQKVYKAIDGKYAATDDAARQAEMNELACSTIFLSLSDSVIRKVGVVDTAKALWDKLDELYTETSMSNRMYLLEKLFKFKLDMSKDIDENIDCFSKLVLDIKRSGDKNIDDYTTIALMNAIPDSYSDVKAAIKYGRDSATVDLIVSALKSKELELKEKSDSKAALDKAMQVRGRSSTKSKDKQSNGKSSDKSNKKHHRSKSRSSSQDFKKSRRCFKCGELGHYSKECPLRKNKKNDSDTVATLAKSDDENGTCFMHFDVISVNASFDSDSNKSEWLVDSGCTYHISPFKDLFTELTPVTNGFVFMANNKQCRIEGIGKICLRFNSGTLYTLKNVKYVPSLCYNLLSCSALESEGLEGRWGNGVMKIFKGSMCLFKAEKQNNLYVCVAHPLCDLPAANAVKVNSTVLWHNRLGHMSEKGMHILHKSGFLCDSDVNMPLPFCDVCVKGKQHRVSFPVSVPTCSSKCILDYLHADVWGPASVTTHGGFSYFLSIVDDFSRKVWVFLMKHKSEVFEKFRNWMCLIENQTGKRLKL